MPVAISALMLMNWDCAVILTHLDGSKRTILTNNVVAGASKFSIYTIAGGL